MCLCLSHIHKINRFFSPFSTLSSSSSVPIANCNRQKGPGFFPLYLVLNLLRRKLNQTKPNESNAIHSYSSFPFFVCALFTENINGIHIYIYIDQIHITHVELCITVKRIYIYPSRHCFLTHTGFCMAKPRLSEPLEHKQRCMFLLLLLFVLVLEMKQSVRLGANWKDDIFMSWIYTNTNTTRISCLCAKHCTLCTHTQTIPFNILFSQGKYTHTHSYI